MSRRRSVSVKEETYFRVRGYTQAKGQSMSGFLEELITEKLDAAEKGRQDGDPPIESAHKRF